MTKEELINRLDNTTYSSALFKVIQYLDEFFATNVVIHKGENRHQYADVLHEWLEGSVCLRTDGDTYTNRILEDANVILSESRYYIKPQEPIYEYLWYDINGNTKWMTIQEWDDNQSFIQAKGTKRVRQ